MSVTVTIPKDYKAGRDNFIINVSPHCWPPGSIRCWSYYVNWQERWIYKDGQKWFPVDSVEGLLEWLVYCDPETQQTQKRNEQNARSSPIQS